MDDLEQEEKELRSVHSWREERTLLYASRWRLEREVRGDDVVASEL